MQSFLSTFLSLEVDPCFSSDSGVFDHRIGQSKEPKKTKKSVEKKPAKTRVTPRYFSRQTQGLFFIIVPRPFFLAIFLKCSYFEPLGIIRTWRDEPSFDVNADDNKAGKKQANFPDMPQGSHVFQRNAANCQA